MATFMAGCPPAFPFRIIARVWASEPAASGEMMATIDLMPVAGQIAQVRQRRHLVEETHPIDRFVRVFVTTAFIPTSSSIRGPVSGAATD